MEDDVGWEPDGIGWAPPQPRELPRISRPGLSPHYTKFEKTQARVSSLAVFEGVVQGATTTAETFAKGL